MSKIGVNATCPCGSGRKFKHCHGAARRPLVSLLDRELDAYQDAESRLDQQLMQTVDPLCLQHSFPNFLFALGFDDLDEKVLPAVIAPILEYAQYEHRWDASSETAVFKALAARSHHFDARQRALVRSHGNAPISLFRIRAVDPGVGIEVQDLLLDRAPFRIHERAGSRGMTVGSILFGRAGWLAELRVFRLYAAGGWLIDPRFELEILQAREARRPAGYENAAALTADALHWVRWYAHWCERLLRPPQIFAPDGEPLEFHTLYFDVINASATLFRLAEFNAESPQALAERAACDGTAIEFAWLGARTSAPMTCNEGIGLSASVDGRSILGYFKLLPGKLELATNSRMSADIAKSQLTGALEGAARYRTRRKRDLEKVMANAASKAPIGSTLSPEEQAALREPMLLNHYRGWLDMSLPALDGLTPREASRRPDRRGHVEALIRGLQSGPFAVPPSVVAMLREQLGLE